MAKIYTGIDIGTSHIKVVISTQDPNGGLRIVATAMSGSKGMRHGYIINIPDATNSIREAVERAERAAGGVRVRSARIAIGGVGLDELRAMCSAAVLGCEQDHAA